MKLNIEIASKRKKIQPTFDCDIIDVTSRSNTDFVKFSPFYPHGEIPIPFGFSAKANSVEGIWQGLKVFENENIDKKFFLVNELRVRKRNASKKRGDILGHLNIEEKKILNYITARKQIYIPCYRFVLDRFLAKEVQELISMILSGKRLVLLDYNTNIDIENANSPLSHAHLITVYIQNQISKQHS